MGCAGPSDVRLTLEAYTQASSEADQKAGEAIAAALLRRRSEVARHAEAPWNGADVMPTWPTGVSTRTFAVRVPGFEPGRSCVAW